MRCRASKWRSMRFSIAKSKGGKCNSQVLIRLADNRQLDIHQQIWFANKQFQTMGPSLKPARDCQGQGLGWFPRMMRGFTSQPLSKPVIGSLPCISWTLQCGGESHPMLFASLLHTIERCWIQFFAYGIYQYLVLWCSNKDGDNRVIISFKIHV